MDTSFRDCHWLYIICSIIVLNCTPIFRGYSNDGSLLDILKAYFVLYLGVIHIVASKLIKDKYNVLRLLLIRCSFLYIIYFSDSSTCVLFEWIISCSNVNF